MAFLFLIACFIIRIIAIGLLLRNRKTFGIRIWPLVIFNSASLVSDVLGSIFCFLEINNSLIINIYTVFELLFVTFYSLRLVQLNRYITLFSKIFSVSISIILCIEIIFYKTNILTEAVSGYAIILQSTIILICCLSMIAQLKPNNTSMPPELIVLFGLFIYSCLCILPTLAYILYFDCNNNYTFSLYTYTSIGIGNIIRDFCFGLFGVLLYRNNRKAIDSKN